MTKTAEIISSFLGNFDYDKFANEHKEDMNKMYTVPLGACWSIGDTEMTNEEYIQKRTQLLDEHPTSSVRHLWKRDVVILLGRIAKGITPNETDLTEEKRKKLAGEIA